MPNLQQNFGARIRELRTARGWSQEHFADVCEIHRSHMGEIERATGVLSGFVSEWFGSGR